MQILLPQGQGPQGTELEGLTADNQHGFLSISVTPIECSVVCHNSWVEKIFEPAIKRLPGDTGAAVIVSEDSYAVFSVNSAGMDAGSRVVDLTLPLALARIPVFFITTYYCDFILVPTKNKERVVQALLSHGFEFSEDESLLKSTGSLAHSARGRPNRSSDPPPPPPTPDVSELQNHTFKLLKERNVTPHVEPGLRLIQCSGREPSGIAGEYSHRPPLSRAQTGGDVRRPSWVDKVDTKLYTSLVSALAWQPKFLSVTLSQDDPPSLLLDRSLLPVFGDSLVGDTERDLVPIFLDLVNLSFEATGIVSGVAGKLVEEIQPREIVELSYRSTARAGAVILPGERLTRALEILRPLLAEE